MLHIFSKHLIGFSSLLALVASSSCLADYWCADLYQWSQGISFSTGDRIRDRGIAYEAKRQTSGETPVKGSSAWQFMGVCGTPIKASCDFNGDGKLDTAKGFPYADPASGRGRSNSSAAALRHAGEVAVVYESDLADKPAHHVWNQNGLGIFAYARIYGRFGEVLSAGDFNRDNFCDLVIGSPNFSLELSETTRGKGTVNILYGSPNGLTTIVLGENGRPINPYDGQRFDQNSPEVPGAAEEGDSFGGALTTGDINGDGFDDLIIGADGEDIVLVPQLGPVTNAGYFHIFYGSKYGIQTSQPKTVAYFQHISGVPLSEVEKDDYFGSSVASADFDHDGFADLAISAPGEDEGKGKVSLFKGSPYGIDVSSRIDFTLANFSPGPQSNGRDFGRVLRAIDFNDDDYIDLEVDYLYGTIQSLDATVRIPGSASGLIFNH